MSQHPEQPDPAVPDWKVKLREEARKLIEAQEATRTMRQKLINEQNALVAQPQIKDTSIGK